MLAIYTPIVRETTISFELEPPSEVEFQQRIENYQQQMPWLVCEINGEIVGYAYASPYRTRAAYQWSVESSVYVGEKYRRQGIAKALYTALLKLLQVQGFYNVVAAIALPNPASLALHEAIGFVSVGVFHRVGFKFGKWLDIGFWQLSLQPEQSFLINNHSTQPINPPLPVSAIQNTPLWDQALTTGLLQLQI
ncbi:N-acetyltransferase [Calothrix anomala FACHB-343]|uniref:N-acetyltransferase n=3 Tax=Calotrichaceae TaxID=2661849 RepID=A0ABR8AKA5_9CYAN|nr:N-acetyltransferase [Calothrix parietina FACHB-288]MBD2229488.1 N-acetyltransferase [Calothrix anomala FACHB-343]